MRLLVTGANGFLGRRLCRALVAQGDEVFALTKRAEAPPGTTRIEADLSLALGKAKLPPVDTIVHLAQSARFREFPAGAADMFAVNLRASFELLEFARRSGVKRFVYASSGGIYGQGSEAFSDAEPVVMRDPLGFYLSTKLAGEIIVDSYAALFSTAILRIFFAYGPGQQSDRLIPRLLDSVRHGRPIVLDGEDGLAINPIYVDDAIAIFLRILAHSDSFKVNLAGAETLTLKEIGNLLGEIVGRAPVYERRPVRQSPRLVGDISALVAKLGYRPGIGFREGARRLADGEL